MFLRKSEPAEEAPRTKKKEDDEQWDKKKILITLFFSIVGILVVFELKSMFIDKNSGVLGSAIQNKPVQIIKPDIKTPNLNTSSLIGSKIEEIKKNVSNLNAEDVATSSPQIQKVLHDIQGIKNLPADQAKQTCYKICSGI